MEPGATPELPSLESLMAVLGGADDKTRARIEQESRAMIAKAGVMGRWVPNPGPQADAYFSQADCLLYGGEPGGGKLLSLDTPIPTPAGWSTMGDLRVGDRVIDETGKPCNVIAKSAIETEQTYRLLFSDGSEIVAGARHQWVTSTRSERQRAMRGDEWRAQRRATRPSRGTGKRPDLAARNTAWAKPKGLPLLGVRTTAEIANTIFADARRLNHSVAVAGPLQLPAADLAVDPYTLGAWLGDGTSESGAITGLDEEIFEQVANGGYTISRYTNPKTRGVLGLQGQLRRLGALNNKHIPPAYLRGSFEQRLALLQGLMDTDGYCDTGGHCEISLTRKALIDGVAELLSSLGIKAQLREGVAKLNGRVIGPKWRLLFLTRHPAFRLGRKLIRQKRGGFRGTHDVRYIVNATQIDPVPMQCIQVDSPNRMYLCGRAMIPTHNSQLLLGLAFNEHQRTLIMRRQYSDLDRLIEDALKLNGGRRGFNGSPPPRLRLSDDRVINFRAAQRIGDEQGTMGQGRDLLGVDEATHFAASQIRFLMGWVRSEVEGQRCRTVLATNPPLTAEGLWVTKMFAPWLDPRFHNPAKPGELRWVVSDEDGNDEWVSGADDTRIVRGKTIRPTSRTYIPAAVRDNPYYAATDYERQLDAMGEPHRSLLLGGFKTAFVDSEFQVIPTAWVQAAQERWTPTPPPAVPMCALGVDASGGGNDPMTIARRHDGWFDKIVKVPGKDLPLERMGTHCAGLIVSYRRDDADVVIDLGGGYGGSIYEHLKANVTAEKIHGYKGAKGSTKRTKDGQMQFVNKRTETLWRFREALDPDQPGGSPIALPPDPTLVADLTAPTWETVSFKHGMAYKVESKEDVCARLGRSTDDGDAVVMSWSNGTKTANVRGGFRPQMSRPLEVVTGRGAPLSARNVQQSFQRRGGEHG